MTRSPAPAPPSRRARRPASLLRALGALLALALTMGGLPWLLWQATTALAPGGWDTLQHLFTRQDTGSVALLALCLIGWLAWTSFVLSLLLEIPAQLRGVRAPRLPGLQISQRAAAALVGALLVLLPTSTALAASPAEATPRTATVVTATAQPADGPHQAVTASHDTEAAAQTTSARDTYTVRDTRPAESLWSIAERLYGNGELYTHLADANEGRTMTDGHTFRADAPIQPGWVLQLPGGIPRHDTHPAAGDAASGPSPRSETRPAAHVVAPAETFSEIAQQETGDAANWPKLYAASRGAQPDGLPRITDPDLIRPGQHITIPATTTPGGDQNSPADQHDRQRQDSGEQGPDRGGAGAEQDGSGAARDPGHDSDTGAGATAPPTSPPSPTASPRPASPSARPGDHESAGSPSARPGEKDRPSASATSTPSPSASGPERSPAATPPSSAQDRPEPPAVSLQQGVGVGAVLAAALTGTLTVRRLRQRRSRKPGQTLPDTVPTMVEGELEQTAHDGADGIERLEATLTALAEQTKSPPPLLRAARITPDGVQVLPDEITAEPVAPFTSSRAGWWHLPDDIALPTPQGEADPPYPALVTLGTDPAGSLVLVNLPALEVLLIDGEPAEQAETMACMATELAIGPHADHLEVLASGLGALGADLKALGVRYVPDPRLAAGEFAARILEAHQDPGDRGLPYIVLCAGELDDDLVWQLAETLDRSRDLTPCVLVLPADAGAVFPDAETINAGTTDAQRIDALGVDVVLQRLDAASIAELAAAFQQTSRPADGPHRVWEHVPPEPVEVPGSAPAVRAVPDHQHDGGRSTDQSRNATAVQEGAADAAQPVVFQALLGASADPGEAALKAVPAAPATDTNGPAAQAERIGPRFLIPPAHALLAPDRTPPIPETDTVQALSEAGPDDTAPRLRLLGTLEIHHVDALEPRLIELAAHLLLKPDSTADRLCQDLGDGAPWTLKTLGSRLRELRTRLGTDPHGNTYVPQRRGKTSPYALSDKVRCDWWEFERLAERGLTRGEDGLPYLERALALVDGVPLGDHPAAWMTGLRTTMQARIVDTAHTVASHRSQDGPHQDFPTARQACTTGLRADAQAEILYRALMRTEAAAGNHSGLQAAIAQWHNANRHLAPEHLDSKTQALAEQLLSAS